MLGKKTFKSRVLHIRWSHLMNQMYGINYPERTANRPERLESKDFLLC